MKPRKKLWIACAALAVVVVCAVAVVSRPAPFDFLRDAKVESVEIADWSHSGRNGPSVCTLYRLYPPKDEVLAAARKELTLDEGWVWHFDPPLDPSPAGPMVLNAGGDMSVAFEANFEWSRSGKPDFVYVVRPPTPFERLLYWAGMRSR